MRLENSPDPLAFRVYQLLWGCLDYVYPPICGGCGRRGSRWCQDCIKETKVIEGNICSRCGDFEVNGGLCPRCVRNQNHFSSLRSWAYYDGPLRNAIHRLKYKRDLALGELFSRYLYNILVNQSWGIDVITCVPLGSQRNKDRGYNQSALLAFPVAIRSGIPFFIDMIKRNRETRSQVGLRYEERLANVASAFISDPKIANNKTVLVIDDIATSGATLNACADSLLSAGSKSVYCLTLARAI